MHELSWQTKIGQGRMKQRKCRLIAKTPDYQLGWAILAECKQLDTLNSIFILCSENSPNITCYKTLSVHNINGQSTISPLCSFLLVDMLSSSGRKVLSWPAWWKTVCTAIEILNFCPNIMRRQCLLNQQSSDSKTLGVIQKLRGPSFVLF